MSPAGKKAIIADFERLLRQHELDFRCVRAGLPHRTVYCRTVSDHLSVLVLLHWNSDREQFCFEVGWLYRATFGDIGSCFDSAVALRRDAAIVPLEVVAGRPAERWWDKQGVSGTGSATPVEGAFAEVLRLGMPFLDRVIQARS